MGSDSKGGGGGSGSYDYFGTIAGAVCAGPVTELLAVIVDGAEVWPRADAWEDGESIVIGNLRLHGGRTWEALTNHTASSSNAPPDETNWEHYSLAAGGADSSDLAIEGHGDLTIFWGTETQTVPGLLTAAENDAGELHPDYKGICYILLDDFLLGRERESAPNVEVIVRKKPVQSTVTGDAALLDDGQANIMAVVAEIFTHANGLGQDAATLDGSSFNTAATSLHTRVAMCGVSPLLDGQVTLRQFLTDLALIGDIFVRYNPATGLIEAGVFSHGAAPGSYETLTIDDLADQRPQFSSQGWASVSTRAVVQFNDRVRAFKQTSIKVDDLRAHRVLGEHRPITLQRPFITRSAQASAHGAESLRTLGRPQLDGKSVYVRKEKGRAIRPGDYVQLDIDIEPGGAQLLQFFRVIDRDMPALGPIRFTLDADETQAPIPFTPGETQIPDEPVTVPAFTDHRIIEAPILLADVVDSVLVLAQRPNKLIIGAHVNFDTITGGTFQRIGSGTGFALKAVLRTALADSDGTLEITAVDQSDLDRLLQQPDDLGAADDTLLAILVKVADGYTGGVGLATTALTGSGASATVTPTLSSGVITAAAVVAGGTGYAVGDKITPTDATGTGAILTVATLSGSAIATLTVSNGGSKGTVDEDADGYAYIEVCSVIAQALDSGDDYDIDVLRARRGTQARAFATADTEVWIIPRSSLVSFFHADFATIRANRINFDSPDVGYFRLAPYTYVAERDIDDCTSIAFRWPEKSQSAPNLELTSPPLSPHAVTSPYPATVSFTGTWSDGDSDLTSWQILLRMSGETDVLIREDVFTPAMEKEFDEDIQIAGAGTWFVTLRAYDALGLKFERIVQITAAAGTSKVATPKFFWNGHKLTTTAYGTTGIVSLLCDTADADIEYRVRRRQFSGAFGSFGSWTPGNEVWVWAESDGLISYNAYQIEARADKATYTQSTTAVLTIEL